jgi:hypothetical protein
MRTKPPRRRRSTPFFFRPARTGCVEVERVIVVGRPAVSVFLNRDTGTYSALVPGRLHYTRYESDSQSRLAHQIKHDHRR